MDDETLSLSADFPGATEAAWLAAVAEALGGAGLEKITTTTDDGIAVRPLCREADWPSARDPLGMPGAAPFLRGPAAARDRHLPWDIRQAFAHPDPAVTNAEILRDLERGVASVELVVDASGRHGVQLCDAGAFDAALSGVLAEIAPVALDHRGQPGLRAGALLADWANRTGRAEGARLALNLDPLGGLARSGLLSGGLDAAMQGTAGLLKALAPRLPQSTLLRSDARVVHEAGGSDAQELASLIASAVDTIRRLGAHGFSSAELARQFLFTLAVDANYGIGIAKLRAARRLWARVLDAFGVDPVPMRLQAVTSARMLTRHDPWVNMLRGTAACFAGAVGGADIVTVRPFSEALGLPEELGRRIARNTQIIAMEESGLGRIADPAGGAWFTESLGQDLAEAAWAAFREIEAEGGYGASLAGGKLQARVAAVRAGRADMLARRKLAITGVSEFAELDRIAAPVATPSRAVEGREIDDSALKALMPGFSLSEEDLTEADPLWPVRLAAPFERLRDHADARTKRTGKRPAIFLATLGPLAVHNARADFARNLFASGGIEAKAAPVPPKDTAELVTAWRASGCALAVLCGSDKRYETDASLAAKALKDAGVQRLYLAGHFEAAGVDSHVYMGVDAVRTLELAHAELGLLP